MTVTAFDGVALAVSRARELWKDGLFKDWAMGHGGFPVTVGGRVFYSWKGFGEYMEETRERFEVSGILDYVIENPDGTFKIGFVTDGGFEVLSLCVENGVAKVGMSSCLPVRGWVEYVEAYARAQDFISRYGLSDGSE